MGALYRLDFPNGKSYVGITSGTVEGRFKEHVEMSQRPKRWAVHRAIMKYGVDSVKRVTLAISDSWEYLCHIEQRAIEVFGTYSRTGGYNLTKGGDGFRGTHTAEARVKIGRASTASNLGTKASAETRAKLSIAHTGIRVSETAKKKLSEAMKGRPKSAETRARLSAALSGKPKAPEHVAKMAATKRGVAPVMSAESREKTRLGLLKRGGGVSFNTKIGKWTAYITLHKVRTYLGAFETEQEARAVRSIATEKALAGGAP